MTEVTIFPHIDFDGMAWRRYDDFYAAPGTDEFKAVQRCNHYELKDVGITTRETVDGTVYGIYKPGKAEDKIRAAIEAAKVKWIASVSAEQCWQAENDELISLTYSDGHHCLRTWGAFTRDKKRLSELLTELTRTHLACNEIRAIVDRTELEAQQLASDYAFALLKRQTLTQVHWRDDVVIAAIRHLTLLDLDRAKKANGVGWSQRESASGHFCFRILVADGKDDPVHSTWHDAAMFLARHILVRYNRQTKALLAKMGQVA